jgi:hypothetical protein
MKKALSLLAVTVLIPLSSAFSAPGTNGVTGNWLGTLEAGSVKLRVVFKISRAPGGDLAATMDSLDQGARDIPVNAVTLSNRALRLEVNMVQGVYEGMLDDAGTKAIGQWKQGVQTLPLTLVRVQRAKLESAPETLSPADRAANQAAAQKVTGTWNGTLAAGAANLHLRVKISKTAAGAATGTMDSLDQGANDIPLSVITCRDGKVRFEVRGIGGVYEGTLAGEGATLSGQWQQAGRTFPLDFKKAPSGN